MSCLPTDPGHRRGVTSFNVGAALSSRSWVKDNGVETGSASAMLDFRRSRKAANELGALPAVVLRVISAGCVCWTGRRGGCPRVERSAVRIVDAKVRCRMAIVGVRTAIVPALDHGFGICGVAGLHRGRAISAWAAIRVHGAITSNVTHIRAVVRGRATAKAGRPRSTIRVAEALIVRTSARPDQAFPGEAAAVHSVYALGVGGARRSATGGDARRSRTALRGAGRRRAPVLEGNLTAAISTGAIAAATRAPAGCSTTAHHSSASKGTS